MRPLRRDGSANDHSQINKQLFNYHLDEFRFSQMKFFHFHQCCQEIILREKDF